LWPSGGTIASSKRRFHDTPAEPGLKHTASKALPHLYSAVADRMAQGKSMAEDEEAATTRYIASNISTQLMLKTIVEMISTMADDPDKISTRGPSVFPRSCCNHPIVRSPPMWPILARLLPTVYRSRLEP